MDAKIRGKSLPYYSSVVPELKAVGRKGMEWDLNDWKWDGDLFTASQLNPLPSDCRSRQLFPVRSEVPANSGLSNGIPSGLGEMLLGNAKEKREPEKRRRVVVVEDEELNDEAGSLNLKLGGQIYPITEGEMEKWEGKSGKKIKVVGASSNRSFCQVEDCQADLSNAKDYHRRHKVCDMHSKASRALVGNVMQRFCQQCSRFHVLQEFDEGKRSCRRRLAGHNRRRRKTHPENIVDGGSTSDESGSNYLLISLLRILANIHSNNSEQTKDQDLLSHLLKNLSNLAGSITNRNLTGLGPGSQDLRNGGTSVGTPSKVPNFISEGVMQGGNSNDPSPSKPTFKSPRKESISANENGFNIATGRTRLNDFDLNNVYDDSEDGLDNLQSSAVPNLGNVPASCPFWAYKDSHKSSPPQTSGNSGSTSSLSPSNSSGESRTDRIVFKLFGKDPHDFPLLLRKQILDWLSHSPSDIESYIRPGCVILTIYIRMDESTWEELCYDLNASLKKLLNASTDTFWKIGWVYTRVRDHVAFIYNGEVVLDVPLPLVSDKNCRILSIKPIAVSASEKVQFSVTGLNLSQSTTRLLCALEGKYLVQEACNDIIGATNSFVELEDIQSFSFPCIMPNVTGRGFIEVADHCLSSSFFPFIVAEKDVCSEIRALESIIDAAESTDTTTEGTYKGEARNQALEFIHEMGWLLHRSHLKSRLGQAGPNIDSFPFRRFRWLLEFSIDHDWGAVVKKLLDVLFSGIVDAGPCASAELALLEVGLLHRAVSRNSRTMVEVLLGYHHDGVSDEFGSQEKQTDKITYLFRPDAVGLRGLTPLHMVASRDGSENLLDALTDDPGMVGIEAWKSARDSTGLTPHDYACLRERYSYIRLIQTKIMKSGSGHVVLDIPATLLESSIKQKFAGGQKSADLASFQIEKNAARPHHKRCSQCEQKLVCGDTRMSLAIYRPAMLSMVAIAAICVCVALLFKSSPEVLYVFRPFRWELLEYGSS